MNKHLRVLLVSAALFAALGPLAAVHAQTEPVTGPVLDDATAAAIANWRASALTMVPAQFHDVVAAMYTGQTLDVDPGFLNEAMIAKAQAEQAAFATLDRSSVALIENYYTVAHDEGSGSGA